MVRVLSKNGDKVVLRVVSDCMVDDIEVAIEDLKKPIPYGIGYYILPQSICGVSLDGDCVTVKELPTVKDAINWCEEYHLEKYKTKVEFHVTPVEMDVNGDSSNSEELSSIFLTKFETEDKLFIVPACVTTLDIGVFENTSVETIKTYGDVIFWFGMFVERTNISKILLPESSLYDFDMDEFGDAVQIEYFSSEVV